MFTVKVAALREGLLLAWNQGYRNVVCEVDGSNMVLVLKSAGAWRFHEQTLLLQGIWDLLDRDWIVRLASVHCDGNVVADWMAKKASSMTILGIQLVEHPSPELELVAARLISFALVSVFYFVNFSKHQK